MAIFGCGRSGYDLLDAVGVNAAGQGAGGRSAGNGSTGGRDSGAGGSTGGTSGTGGIAGSTGAMENSAGTSLPDVGDAGSAIDASAPSDAQVVAGCVDGITNAAETDVDCGGPSCQPCTLGNSCLAATDCETAECTGNLCVGWPYRRSVVVSAGSVAADLSQFPLLVSTGADAQLAARVALAGGLGIRFTSDDGVTTLNHEVEQFDATTGELWAWVQVPLLSASASTTLYFLYGNSAASDQQNTTAVWNGGYTSVWHLSNDPGPGGTGDLIDSTGNSPGTAHSSMTSDDLVAGQVGGGIDFDGSDDEILFTNTFTGTGAHTISGWIEQRASNGRDALLAFGSDAVNESRALFTVFDDGPIAGGFYFNDFFTATDLRSSGWRQIVWNYDGANSRIYVDGLLSQTFAQSGANTQGTNGWLGNVFLPDPNPGFGPDQHLDGRLDEVRVFAGIRDDHWIAAEFDNQSSPTTFAVVGSEQLRITPL